MPESLRIFDVDCRDCPRLARFLDTARKRYPTYYARPVAPFGPLRAKLLVVGLAPGMHGANRTGRPFTGDYAGILLYATLHKFGFASHGGSNDADGGLKLLNCRVTNAVKCLPPANKPKPEEVRRCNRYLAGEIEAVQPKAILALGRVAHEAVLQALGLRSRDHVFAHGAAHELAGVLPGARLFDSYHCSRYNTQTRRLTRAMFERIVQDIVRFLASPIRLAGVSESAVNR